MQNRFDMVLSKALRFSKRTMKRTDRVKTKNVNLILMSQFDSQVRVQQLGPASSRQSKDVLNTQPTPIKAAKESIDIKKNFIAHKKMVKAFGKANPELFQLSHKIEMKILEFK